MTFRNVRHAELAEFLDRWTGSIPEARRMDFYESLTALLAANGERAVETFSKTMDFAQTATLYGRVAIQAMELIRDKLLLERRYYDGEDAKRMTAFMDAIRALPQSQEPRGPKE